MTDTDNAKLIDQLRAISELTGARPGSAIYTKIAVKVAEMGWALAKARKDAIEECAKLVEAEPYRAMNDRDNLAAAIRSLIDKAP